MTEAAVIALLVLTIKGAVPLVFAALGELVVEKAGVLNLGVEGMMLVGAVSGFIGAHASGSLAVGVLVAIVATVLVSLIFGFLTLSLLANQVATGLALTIFGIGLSAFVGKPYESVALTGMTPVEIPLLSDIPIVGPLFFAHDPLLYLAIVAFVGVSWFLYRTRKGLILRSVGEAPEAAHALGYPVIRIRYLAVMFGAGMAGLGGAYLSLVLSPQWQENMTAQRGWIALALVVFATWRPARVMLGAWLFGALTILNFYTQSQGGAFLTYLFDLLPFSSTWLAFYAQAGGITLSSHWLATVPYLSTILVLVLISNDATKIRLHAPASLGKPFRAGG